MLQAKSFTERPWAKGGGQGDPSPNPHAGGYRVTPLRRDTAICMYMLPLFHQPCSTNPVPQTLCHIPWHNYLQQHASPEDIEYYLCGPPKMNQAVFQLPDDLGVEQENIAFDDFGD